MASLSRIFLVFYLKCFKCQDAGNIFKQLNLYVKHFLRFFIQICICKQNFLSLGYFLFHANVFAIITFCFFPPRFGVENNVVSTKGCVKFKVKPVQQLKRVYQAPIHYYLHAL